MSLISTDSIKRIQWFLMGADVINTMFMLLVIISSGIVLVGCNTLSEEDIQTQTAAITQTAESIAIQTAVITQTAESVATQSAAITQTAESAVTHTAAITQTAESAATQSAAITQTAESNATQAAAIPPTVEYNASIIEAIERAREGVTSNEEWETLYPDGVVQDFDGVLMVLVPAGCYMMGSTDEQLDQVTQITEEVTGVTIRKEWVENQQPAHEQCFEEPFWIDKYEVTQEDFVRYGGEIDTRGATGSRLPTVLVNWQESAAICEARGSRLPTEREWEYAAKGPDNLIFPWGNEWVDGYAVWNNNDDKEVPEEVGSLPTESASWVGAFDMAGNVTEWVSSLNESYPYDDSHESDSPPSSTERIIRGAGWYSTVTYALSSSHRSGTTYSNFGGGFRCVRDI